MKIGELAKLSHCPIETIRYYEKAGLLQEPLRTEGNYRDYSDEHVTRLRFVRNCRALDMTHQEIHSILALMDEHSTDCHEVNVLVDAHIQHVDQRIAELQSLRDELNQLRLRCARESSIDQCGIVQGIVAMDANPKPRKGCCG
jgi:Cd(II)/Pb(II)-responsive transcriptional regulator